MPKKRFKVCKLVCGLGYITDTKTGRVYGYGRGLDFSEQPNNQHRAYYTDADAKDLVKWLNSLPA